jgi:hypothetical protein
MKKMPPKIQKPEIIKLNLMRGPRDKEKTINAKLKGGLIEYPGMDPMEPIVWLGQPQYALFDIKSKKSELFYDKTRHSLLKLSDLGGAPQTDAIADLTKYFVIAGEKTKENMAATDTSNSLGKWTLGIIFLVAIVAMVFMYLMATHGFGSSPAQAAPSLKAITNSTLIHINAT